MQRSPDGYAIVRGITDLGDNLECHDRPSSPNRSSPPARSRGQDRGAALVPRPMAATSAFAGEHGLTLLSGDDDRKA